MTGDGGDEPPTHLAASKLGTKDYWDQTYLRELSTFTDNTADEGEVWFGANSETTIIDFLLDLYPPTQKISVLDLGTGNGHLLVQLHEDGCEGWDLHGIDYSRPSIDLARSIARERGVDTVRFSVVDFMMGEGQEIGTVDVVVDKGTFDAISLSDQVGPDGRKLFEGYAREVVRFMREESVLLITSCNWTEDELVKWMTKDGCLKYKTHIKRPKFSFGGASGSTIATVAFKRA